MHDCYGVGSESENFLALAHGTSADHSTAPVTARPEIKQLAPPEPRTKRSTKQELSHSIKQESSDSYQPRTELPSPPRHHLHPQQHLPHPPPSQVDSCGARQTPPHLHIQLPPNPTNQPTARSARINQARPVLSALLHLCHLRSSWAARISSSTLWTSPNPIVTSPTTGIRDVGHFCAVR
jgi:hypothetical protein